MLRCGGSLMRAPGFGCGFFCLRSMGLPRIDPVLDKTRCCEGRESRTVDDGMARQGECKALDGGRPGRVSGGAVWQRRAYVVVPPVENVVAAVLQQRHADELASAKVEGVCHLQVSIVLEAEEGVLHVGDAVVVELAPLRASRFELTVLWASARCRPAGGGSNPPAAHRSARCGIGACCRRWPPPP